MKKRLSTLLYTYVLPFLLWLVYTGLRLTWRVTLVEPPEFQNRLQDGSPLVLAHWHGDIPAIVYLLPRYRAVAMISTSNDGALITGVVRLLGADAVRGSSTRGGAGALKGILKLARSGHRPALAVDGPKGPRHKAKAGVFEVSKVTGGEIAAIAAAWSRGYTFERAWDKTGLPYPFARVAVVWSKPLPAVPRDGDPHAPEHAARLESAFAAAKQQASKLIAANHR